MRNFDILSHLWKNTDAPKNVTIQTESSLTVNENTTLTLHCIAQSYPEVISFTWIKLVDGKHKILQKSQNITLDSVSASDSGRYSCTATNSIGKGTSQQAMIQVKCE